MMSVGRKLVTLIATSALLAGVPASATPKGDLKDQASTLIGELESNGWPESRCSLGAFFDKGFIYASSGTLENGDRLLKLNDVDVDGMPNERVLEVLRGIGATATIPVVVERQGAATELQLQCEDSRADQDTILRGLNFAKRKKVEECVSTLRPLAARNPIAAMYGFQCAALTDNPFSHDLPSVSYDAAKMLIQEATIAPKKRVGAVRFLRSQEGIMRTAKRDELIAVTATWEGDEDIWEKSKPDWRRYRQNAERTLLSGFFDPGAAIVEWPYGFKYGTWKPVLQGRIEGYWTCGRVNGKNRMGGYVGSRYFVVVMGHSAEVLFYEVGDGGSYDFVAGACQNSVSQLPPPPAEFFETAASAPVANSAVPAPSVADELKKLAELFEAGALTKEEYDAAKAKVLQGG